MEIGIIIYIAINIFTFLLYALDKLKAIRHSYRIPENVLLTFSFFGPVGAFFGMLLFRHKIRKNKFIIIIPFFLLLHVIFTILYTIYLWKTTTYENSIEIFNIFSIIFL